MDATLIESYARLVSALRDRLCELNITLPVVDQVAGLPARYSSKLLGQWPCKSMGAISLFPILAALGLRLRLEPDDDGLAKLRTRSDWLEMIRPGPRYRPPLNGRNGPRRKSRKGRRSRGRSGRPSGRPSIGPAPGGF
jgi:hypothetical protein